MADRAVASLSASMLPDEVKTTLSGTQMYDPTDSSDSWFYLEKQVSGDTSNNHLIATIDYYGTSAVSVHADDKIRWLCVKNRLTDPTRGIGIVLDGGNAVYNEPDLIVIGPEEMVILKTPNTTVANIHARTCVLNAYGVPESQGTSGGKAFVIGILDDVA